MQSMDTLTLDLAVEDINLILETLGQLPFVRVYGLIGRIQDQARAQITAGRCRAELGAQEAARG